MTTFFKKLLTFIKYKKKQFSSTWEKKNIFFKVFDLILLENLKTLKLWKPFKVLFDDKKE